MNQNLKSKMYFSLSMIVFGTIGLFRRFVGAPSGVIAFSRGIIGALFLVLLLLLRKERPDTDGVKKNALFLVLSGACIGFNWMFLFEAYNYTTVATATLCYYMAPIIVLILSPFILKEKLTIKKAVCVLTALLGMVFVSGVTKTGTQKSIKGIIFGLSAALLYAFVMILNQKIHNIGAYEKTIVQLFTAALVILPYSLMNEKLSTSDITAKSVTGILIIGIVHTGVCYALYFGSMDEMNSQTVALLSYIDPIVAVILSALLLKEHMGTAEIIGAVLVLGSTVSGEIDFKRLRAKNKKT